MSLFCLSLLASHICLGWRLAAAQPAGLSAPRRGDGRWGAESVDMGGQHCHYHYHHHEYIPRYLSETQSAAPPRYECTDQVISNPCSLVRVHCTRWRCSTDGSLTCSSALSAPTCWPRWWGQWSSDTGRKLYFDFNLMLSSGCVTLLIGVFGIRSTVNLDI